MILSTPDLTGTQTGVKLKSQNHRMAEVGQDLLRSPGEAPAQAGPPELAAHDHVTGLMNFSTVGDLVLSFGL